MLPHAPSCRPSDTWSSCHGARRALHRIFLGWAHAVPAWMDPHECPLRSCTLTKLSDASSPHVAGTGSFGLQPVHSHDRAKNLMRTAGTAGDVSFSPMQIADPRCAPRGRRRVAGESSPPIKISRAPLQCPDPFCRPAQQTKLWSVPHACCPRAIYRGVGARNLLRTVLYIVHSRPDAPRVAARLAVLAGATFHIG